MDKFLNLHVKLNDQASSGLKKLSGLITGAVVLGIGKKAVEASRQWGKAISDVSTLLGNNTDAVKALDDGLTNLLKNTPVSPDELGESAYLAVSAGFTKASDSLKVLEASSKLGVAGLGSTQSATQLLTVAMNAFKKDAEDADEVANVLFKSVKNGITNIDQLSQSFGKMAGNATAANLTFEDVQAATTALTTITGKTSESQNALAQVFLELTRTGGLLDKNLQDNGSNLEMLNAAIQSEGGLVAGFESVRDQMGLTDTQFKNMFSSAEGGTAVYQLLTSGNEAYTNSLQDNLGATDDLTEAYEKQKETTDALFQELSNNLFVALKELGNAIIPVLIPLLQFLTEQLSAIIDGAKIMWGAFKDLAAVIKDDVMWVIDGVASSIEGLVGIFDRAISAAKSFANALPKADGSFSPGSQFSTGPTRRSSVGVSHFAEGGLVGDTIPAMLSPGEVVLNAAQQKNVASGLSGAQITITGNTFLDENSAEKMADLFTKKLALHMAI